MENKAKIDNAAAFGACLGAIKRRKVELNLGQHQMSPLI